MGLYKETDTFTPEGKRVKVLAETQNGRYICIHVHVHVYTCTYNYVLRPNPRSETFAKTQNLAETSNTWPQTIIYNVQCTYMYVYTCSSEYHVLK